MKKDSNEIIPEKTITKDMWEQHFRSLYKNTKPRGINILHFSDNVAKPANFKQRPSGSPY